MASGARCGDPIQPEVHGIVAEGGVLSERGLAELDPRCGEYCNHDERDERPKRGPSDRHASHCPEDPPGRQGEDRGDGDEIEGTRPSDQGVGPDHDHADRCHSPASRLDAIAGTPCHDRRNGTASNVEGNADGDVGHGIKGEGPDKPHDGDG